MTLELNRSPYFNDYSADSNHARVVFKDGVPLQVRELNNMQSIMQNQIRNFGDHIFTNGSRVSNARSKAVDYDYVVLNGLSPWDNTSLKTDILVEGVILKGRTTQLQAVVILVDVGDDITLYVTYNGTAIDGETRTFIQGETVDVYDETGTLIYSITVACPDCDATGDLTGSSTSAIGKGTIYVIDEGVFYYNGMFVNNERQQIVISRHQVISSVGNDTEFVVGLRVDESIETAEINESLYDNSLGYPNKRSPGADRHKIDLILVKRDETESVSNGFIRLAYFIGGIQISQKADSEYSIIMDTIAKRTYEESGNYTLKPQQVRFQEHTSIDANGLESNYIAVASPNTYYVNGYRYETKLDYYAVTPKARDTKKLTQYINQFEELSYILMQPMAGTSAYASSPLPGSKVYDESSIALYDGPVSNGGGGSYLPTGSQIGSIRIFDASLESGTPGNGTAIYRYYFYKPTFVEGKSFSDVKCAYHATNKFIATMVLEDGVVKIYNKGRSELIWRLKKNNIKSLRDAQNPDNGSIDLTRRVKLSGTTDSQGNITFSPKDGEMFVSLGKNSICLLTTDGVPTTIDLTAITTSQTPMSINLTLGQSNSGKEVVLITNAIMTSAKERSKRILINTDTLSNIVPSAKIVLSKADTKRLTKVTAYPKMQLANTASHVPVDVELFEFNNGQTDISYENGWVKLKDGASYPTPVAGYESNYNVLFEYEYYEHSGSAGVLTVDSYTPAINSGGLTYSDIPTYTSNDGNEYPLAYCMDFRPLVVDDVTEEPLLPAINELALFDLEYYLPRVDILQISKDGVINTKLGNPSDTPVPPKPDLDCMNLMELWLPAYTHNLIDIKIKRIDNKRYTMRDIGKLASRLKNVEYYTVLNLLEKSASDMSIKDADGYDRFKNGFIADNFKDFQATDVKSPEFKSAIDPTRAELRPTFGMQNRKLVFDPASSSHYAISNGLITLPYNHVMVDEQPFATKSISINPYFMFTQKGSLSLTPNVDTWVSTTKQPDFIMTQDFGTEAYADMANRMNNTWSTWTQLNVTSQKATATNTTAAGVSKTSNSTAAALQTTTSDIAATKPAAIPAASTAGKLVASSRSDSYNLGDRITDVSLAAYMREVDITFNGSNMAPVTRVYAFFDTKDVNEHTRPIGGKFGDPLFVDGLGNVQGVFRVPADTFRVGQKSFKLTGDSSNQDDPDTMITWAENVFYSGGINQSTQSITLNTTSPTFNYTPEVAKPIVNKAANTSSKTISTTQRSSATASLMSALFGRRIPKDPVAQSFSLETSSFITKLDIFLAAADMGSDLVWVELRTMDNGYPTTVVLARKEYKPAELITSEDSESPHTVVFDNPVYVEGGVEYCFVVGGASPNTRIWVAKVGDKIVNSMSQIVETQPAVGSSFRSQEGSTWTAEQYEDIKYRIYVAEFFETSMELSFKVPDSSVNLSTDALEFETGSNRVRVLLPDHAMVAGDTFKLNVLEDTFVTLSGTAPAIGETLISTSGSASVHDVTSDGSTYYVQIRSLIGSISGTYTTPTSSGTVSSGTIATIMGIPVSQFSETQTVIDSDFSGFTFSTTDVATSTGRHNGNAKVRANLAYNVINNSCSNMMYGCSDSWTFEGIAHNPHNSPSLLPEYSKVSEISVVMGNDHHLSQPYKLVTVDNLTKMAANINPDTVLRGILTSTNRFISPVIMADSFSTTFVTNRVGSSGVGMNTTPNAPGRYVAETDPTAGVEQFKYVTRRVTLSKPAADLYIMLDAYKDEFGDFDLYYRSLALHENIDIATKSWTLIPLAKVNNTSGEKIEYSVVLSEAFADWLSHDEISSFQVKIVGKTINSSMPPVFSNLRIIATT